jgi:hypothetical protein
MLHRIGKVLIAIALAPLIISVLIYIKFEEQIDKTRHHE